VTTWHHHHSEADMEVCGVGEQFGVDAPSVADLCMIYLRVLDSLSGTKIRIGLKNTGFQKV